MLNLVCTKVTIGERALFGPGVHIYAVDHPLDAQERATGKLIPCPVVIGNDVSAYSQYLPQFG